MDEPKIPKVVVIPANPFVWEKKAWEKRKIELKNSVSGYYNKVCYGYQHNKNGQLVIDRDKAKVVKDIFYLYMRGDGVDSIRRNLEFRGIPAPSGGNKWNARTINIILRNEKYTGNLVVFKNRQKSVVEKWLKVIKQEEDYEFLEHHEPIISVKNFLSVQRLIELRSNVEIGADGEKKRKSTRYSSKRELSKVVEIVKGFQ